MLMVLPIVYHSVKSNGLKKALVNQLKQLLFMKIQSTVAKCVLLFLAMVPLGKAFAQPTITPTNSATTLANALVGPGVTISNATITCPSGGSGTFSGASSPLNIG